MTESEYNWVQFNRPDLRLPEWYNLDPAFRNKLAGFDLEQLIAGRTAVILRRDNPDVPDSPESQQAFGSNFKFV